MWARLSAVGLTVSTRGYGLHYPTYNQSLARSRMNPDVNVDTPHICIRHWSLSIFLRDSFARLDRQGFVVLLRLDQQEMSRLSDFALSRLGRGRKAKAKRCVSSKTPRTVGLLGVTQGRFEFNLGFRCVEDTIWVGTSLTRRLAYASHTVDIFMQNLICEIRVRKLDEVV